VNKDFRIRLLLALQTSLLGNVSANMRAVSCDVTGKTITVQVVFDGLISPEDEDEMEEMGSELASHFEQELVNIRCIRIDAPQSLRDGNLAILVYQRRE
jgi:hypothetical protein